MNGWAVIALALGALALLTPGVAMAWPVPGPITSGFRTAERPTHNGVDIAAPVGTPIRAALPGVVVSRYWHDDGGNSLRVTYDNGYTAGFAHLSGYEVNQGDTFAANAVLGYTGETGNARGPHLHYTVRDPDGQYVDPVTVSA